MFDGLEQKFKFKNECICVSESKMCFDDTFKLEQYERSESYYCHLTTAVQKHFALEKSLKMKYISEM